MTDIPEICIRCGRSLTPTRDLDGELDGWYCEPCNLFIEISDILKWDIEEDGPDEWG